MDAGNGADWVVGDQIVNAKQFVRALESCHRNLFADYIHRDDFYRHHPNALSAHFAPDASGHLYFFGEKHGEPFHREVDNHGYWKHTGLQYLVSVGETKAIRRSYVFYDTHHGPEGIKTHWVMEEFQLLVYGPWQAEEVEARVLCQIHESS